MKGKPRSLKRSNKFNTIQGETLNGRINKRVLRESKSKNQRRDSERNESK